MAPYEGAIKAAAYLLIAAAICAGLYALHNSVYQSGARAERVIWQAKENKDLAEAGRKYAELQTKYRKMERQSALDQAAIAENYRKEVKENDRKKNAVIADLRRRSIVLRDPGGTQSCRSGAAETGAAAPGSNGKAGGELSGELAEFLVSEASRADEVVKQLTTCQKVVESDRN